MSKKIIQFILKFLSRRVIKKYKPLIIGITGSVGKSSTKEAVYEVLKHDFKVRVSQGNYNNEIGLPLTILGLVSAEKNVFGWFKIFFGALFNLPEKNDYPRILILEMAADHPGDIDYLLKIVKPEIGTLTSIGPTHLKFFKSVENVFEEKKKLIEALPINGWAILNKDDGMVSSLERRVKSKVLTFGLSEEATIRAIEIVLGQELNGGAPKINGLQFKVKYKGSLVPISLPNIISYSSIYAIEAAIAVGLSFNLNLLQIANYLSSYKNLAGRMSVIKGKKETLIIDDTYNSSPKAVEEALQVLSEIKIGPSERKWVVLADMLELGEGSSQLHYEVGEKIAKANKFDFLLTTGKEAAHMAFGAKEKGMNEKNVLFFEDRSQLIEFLQKNILKGDVILIKGSRGMQMEKAVEAIMLEPEKAEKLLVHL